MRSSIPDSSATTRRRGKLPAAVIAKHCLCCAFFFAAGIGILTLVMLAIAAFSPPPVAWRAFALEPLQPGSARVAFMGEGLGYWVRRTERSDYWPLAASAESTVTSDYTIVLGWPLPAVVSESRGMGTRLSAGVTDPNRLGASSRVAASWIAMILPGGLFANAFFFAITIVAGAAVMLRHRHRESLVSVAIAAWICMLPVFLSSFGSHTNSPSAASNRDSQLFASAEDFILAGGPRPPSLPRSVETATFNGQLDRGIGFRTYSFTHTITSGTGTVVLGSGRSQHSGWPIRCFTISEIVSRQEPVDQSTIRTVQVSWALFATNISVLTACMIAARRVPTLITRWRRRRDGLCEICGYSKAGLVPHTPCPECGSRLAATQTPSPSIQPSATRGRVSP